MPRFVVLVAVCAALSGCWLISEKKNGKGNELDASGTASATATKLEAPRFCGAIRGNGNYIITHFTALARLAEHYGPFDALAGGSSGSVTVFLYESMLQNPSLKRCGERDCTTDEVGYRLSLMLKSIEGYVTVVVTKSDEALAVRGLAPIVERVQSEGIEALITTNPIAAAAKLAAILSSDDLKSLINPEVLAMLTSSIDLSHNVREVYTAITSAGSFKAEDPIIFFRPGVLSFAGLAEKIGRMGSLYAGYGPYDKAVFDAWLNSCAAASRGLTWDEAAKKPGPNGKSCGDAFQDLAFSYRQKFTSDEKSVKSRIDDPVGLNFHGVVANAVLTKGTLANFTENLARYRKGEPLQFTPDFTEVRYGYFARPEDLQLIEANPRGFQDLKTSKRLPIGQVSWRTALTLSPAEPGLARLQEFPDGSPLVSAAGWPDLHPVQTLKNLGCERVVYITRRGEDSKFGRGVAKLLGMPQAAETALFDLDVEASSYASALKLADAVWCTDWDRFKDAEIAAMAQEAYVAPLQTRDDFFANEASGAAPYPTRTTSVGARGCTPIQ